MAVLIIILIGIYMFFLIPAFMFTWEGLSDFEEPSYFLSIGCSGLLCMLIGFPGVIIALLIKGIIKLINLPKEREEHKKRLEYIQRQQEEQRRNKEQEALRKKEYQESLDKKRKYIYPNSPVTREIVTIVTRNHSFPYSIEITAKRLVFYFENNTQSYVFQAHKLPNMDENEERIFAEVLNQKLDNQYHISNMTDCRNIKYGDGTDGVYSVHIGTKMSLKVTRSF